MSRNTELQEPLARRAFRAFAFTVAALVGLVFPTAWPSAARGVDSASSATAEALGLAQEDRPAGRMPAGIFEVRVYTIAPGKLDTFARWMERADKFQESVGMRILGHFTAPEQNKYIWIRIYPDEPTRQQRFKAVYESAEWKTKFTDAREAGFEAAEVFLTRAAKYSKLQYTDAASGRLPAPAGGAKSEYEFRFYDIKPGMLDTFVGYMGEKMIPWQESHPTKQRVVAQLVPYGRIVRGAVEPETGTYLWVRTFKDQASRKDKYRIYEDKAGFASVGSAGEAGFAKARAILFGNPTSFSKLQ
jgi:hypothetical protein